jgi:carotenoid cleavage dioxygenase-like enzyme
MRVSVLGALLACATLSLAAPAGLLGNFLRSMNESLHVLPLQPHSAPLAGATHFRLVPGVFPQGMGYHFDGLATVMSFRFDAQQLTVNSKYYASEAQQHYSQCLFEGTGTGPTLGFRACLTNPGVNLLPLNNQLWLTIDTAFWGRVDPATLGTLGSKVNVSSLVLNAHPACDPATNECLVQYPCSKDLFPLTNQSCVGRLVWSDADMTVQELARVTLPEDKLIQHSHSPCITPNYFVSKLDAFGPRLKPADAGLLEFLHQVEDDQWLVYHRATGAVRIMFSNATSFVNNHFWNCWESPSTGAVVVDLVAATSDYLDAYFEASLAKPTNWSAMFHAPVRCTVPISGTSIACEPFWPDGASAGVLFDYPTFSPLVKMQPFYKFFYAIAPSSPSAKWFDRLIKVSALQRAIVADWASPGVFLTEASFVPHADAQAEDDGSLVSVAYNSTADASALAVFSARTLLLVSWYPLDQVIPFHAHGVTCRAGKCYSNP